MLEQAVERRLKRLLQHSDRFLWGLVDGENQSDIFKNLKAEGIELFAKDFNFTVGSYEKATESLLDNPGIEALLFRYIVPRIKRRFVDPPFEGALNFLRNFWNRGKLPDISFEIGFQISSSRFDNPFLVITSLGKSDQGVWDVSKKYVERWTDFSAIWFEDIELIPEVRQQLNLSSK